jgi:nitrogen fixation protein NifU and related proteins
MLEALYQDKIIELSRNSRDRGRLEAPDASARVDNPLCGDRVTMDIALKDGRVSAIGHKVRGCALCEAAAEIISQNAIGLDAMELSKIEAATRAFMTSSTEEHPWAQLSVFAPVREVKSRHECVYLPFTAVAKALAEVQAS